MNKSDLTRAVHHIHGGMSYSDAARIVDMILETIKGRLVRGERVLLSGFGSFRVVVRRDRKGINPQTGTSMLIQGRRAVSFRPSKCLKAVR